MRELPDEVMEFLGASLEDPPRGFGADCPAGRRVAAAGPGARAGTGGRVPKLCPSIYLRRAASHAVSRTRSPPAGRNENAPQKSS